MNESAFSKFLFALGKLVSKPRTSMGYIRRGFLDSQGRPDEVFSAQRHWQCGSLPRVSLPEVFPGLKQLDVYLPRAFDRVFMTSITIEEACCLCGTAKLLGAKRVLEIGTFNGNTTLALASSVPEGGRVITVDLPPDFDAQKMTELPMTKGCVNLTARDELGVQFRHHPVGSRIRQVYGDTATLSWKNLGGPFDLIFIDGCHSEEYVLSDSWNALSVLADRGTMIWHDYGMVPDVSNAVDRLASELSEMEFCAILGTRLAIALRKKS